MPKDKRSNLIIVFFILIGGFFATLLLFQNFNFVRNPNTSPIVGSVAPSSSTEALTTLFSSMTNLIFYKILSIQSSITSYNSGIVPAINVSSTSYGIVNSNAGLVLGNAVMKDGSIYRMWWCGLSSYNYSGATIPAFTILSSNSTDGINWSPGQIAINYTAFTLNINYTELNCFPSVVKSGNTFYMYYTGLFVDINRQNLNASIFLATSNDGINWSANSQPIFSSNNLEVLAPTGVIYNNNQFYLYYANSSYDNATFLATSSDGINFSPQNNGQPVLITPTSQVGDTKFLGNLNLYFRLFGGTNNNTIYWTYSQDGINWLPFDSTRTIQTLGYGFSPSILSYANGTSDLQTSAYYTGFTSLDANCTVGASNCGIALSYLNVSLSNLTQSFNATDFKCISISNGYNCRLNYTSTLNESAVVAFLFTDSNGNVVNSVVPIANSGTSQVSAIRFCTNSTTLNVGWKAYRQSDSTLSNAIAWSKSYELQTISC